MSASARFASRAVIVLPVLAAILWLLSDAQGRNFVATPGAWIVLAPGLILVTAGAIVVARQARAHHRQQVYATGRDASMLERVIGGGGSQRVCASQLVRAIGITGLLVAPLFVGGSVLVRAMCVAAIASAAALPFVLLASRKATYQRALEHEMPLLVEATLAVLSAGGTIADAVEHGRDMVNEPLRAELARMSTQMRMGRSSARVLAMHTDASAVPSFELWASTLALAARRGEVPEAALHTLLADVRTRQREHMRRRAATIGPRMQLATTLLIVPGILWLVLVVVGRGLFQQLATAGVVA